MSVRVTVETVVEFNFLIGDSECPARLPLADIIVVQDTVIVVPFGMLTVSPETAAELRQILDQHKANGAGMICPDQDEGEPYVFDGRK